MFVCFCLFVCFTPFRPHTWAQTILPPLYSFGTPQCDAASRFASIPAHPSLHVGAALDHPARSPSSAAGPGPRPAPPTDGSATSCSRRGWDSAVLPGWCVGTRERGGREDGVP